MSTADRRNYTFNPNLSNKEVKRLTPSQERYFARRAVAGLAALALLGSGVSILSSDSQAEGRLASAEAHKQAIIDRYNSGEFKVVETKKGNQRLKINFAPGSSPFGYSQVIVGPDENPRPLADKLVEKLESKGITQDMIDGSTTVVVPTDAAQPIIYTINQVNAVENQS